MDHLLFASKVNEVGGFLKVEECALALTARVVFNDFVHLGVVDYQEHLQLAHLRHLYDLLQQRSLSLAFQVDPLQLIVNGLLSLDLAGGYLGIGICFFVLLVFDSVLFSFHVSIF